MGGGGGGHTDTDQCQARLQSKPQAGTAWIDLNAFCWSLGPQVAAAGTVRPAPAVVVSLEPSPQQGPSVRLPEPHPEQEHPASLQERCRPRTEPAGDADGHLNGAPVSRDSRQTETLAAGRPRGAGLPTSPWR